MLPRHDTSGWIRRTGEYYSFVLAAALLACNAWQWSTAVLLSWNTPVLIFCGVASADFLSGLLHWFADTWGSVSMPMLGRRVLHPFRVHHTNPGDILDRDFVDLNGDVALITTPVLATALCIPENPWWGFPLWEYMISACTAGLFTNQVHQWAHSYTPPPLVRRLQRCALLLRPQMHTLHHREPYATHNCITTGWCNPLLSRLEFFPRLERIVTGITGRQPRHDDQHFLTAQHS